MPLMAADTWVDDTHAAPPRRLPGRPPRPLLPDHGPAEAMAVLPLPFNLLPAAQASAPRPDPHRSRRARPLVEPARLPHEEPDLDRLAPGTRAVASRPTRGPKRGDGQGGGPPAEPVPDLLLSLAAVHAKDGRPARAPERRRQPQHEGVPAPFLTDYDRWLPPAWAAGPALRIPRPGRAAEHWLSIDYAQGGAELLAPGRLTVAASPGRRPGAGHARTEAPTPAVAVDEFWLLAWQAGRASARRVPGERRPPRTAQPLPAPADDLTLLLGWLPATAAASPARRPVQVTGRAIGDGTFSAPQPWSEAQLGWQVVQAAGRPLQPRSAQGAVAAHPDAPDPNPPDVTQWQSDAARLLPAPRHPGMPVVTPPCWQDVVTLNPAPAAPAWYGHDDNVVIGG